MREKTRKLTITALLVALTFLLGLTPIGYIPIPPIAITLICIPVIIGTITQGLRVGLILGFVFGLTSFLQIFIRPTPLSQLIFSLSPLKTIILVFIPRLIVPITTFFVHKAINGESRSRQHAAVGTAAFVGSITNTILFLGALYLLFLPEADQMAAAFGTTPELLLGVIATIGAINGLPEAAVAVVLCIPIVYALSKLKNRNKTKIQNKTES